jgi:hypothetical protein
MQGEEIGKGDEGEKKTFASRIRLKDALGIIVWRILLAFGGIFLCQYFDEI